MPRLRVLALFIAAALASPHPAHAQAHPPLDPHNVVAPALTHPIDLTSTWLVHQGDDPHFADPALDDSHWPTIDTARPLASYGIVHPDFLWYRTHVHIPPRSHGLAILLRSFAGSEQVFVNGVLTGPSRLFPPGGLTSVNFDLRAPIPDAVIASGDLTIAIRAQVKTLAAITGNSPALFHSSAVLLGDSSTLADASVLFAFRNFTSNLVNIALTLVILLIAVALALTLRQEREYLALCVYLAGTAFTAAANIWGDTHEILPSRWSGLPGTLVDLLTILAGIEFARIILRLPRTRWIAAYEWALVAFLSFLEITRILTFGRPPFQLGAFAGFAVLGILYVPVNLLLPLFALWIWRRTRNFDALLLSIPLLLRSVFLYVQIGCFLAFLLHLRSTGALPIVPLRNFDVAWNEIADFLFFLALLVFLILRTVRLARARAALAAEVAAAQSVQQLLLARSSIPTPGFLVETVYRPASEVGGDFFLISPSPHDGSLIAIVGDVSGKGLTAAMRVSMILGILRREPSRNPPDILAALNDALLAQGEGFTTACCLRLDLSGHYTLSNAGHISPYLAGAELVAPPALPLGLAPGQSFEVLTGTLPPGERLVLLSDGVPEARSPKGALLGFDRLPTLTLEPATAIADQAQTFGQEDDITVLTLALA